MVSYVPLLFPPFSPICPLVDPAYSPLVNSVWAFHRSRMVIAWASPSKVIIILKLKQDSKLKPRVMISKQNVLTQVLMILEHSKCKSATLPDFDIRVSEYGCTFDLRLWASDSKSTQLLMATVFFENWDSGLSTGERTSENGHHHQQLWKFWVLD